MKFKKIISTILFSTTVLSSTIVFGNVNNEKSIPQLIQNQTKNNLSKELGENGLIESRLSHLVVNESLTSKTGSQSFEWDTSSNYRYYRIYIDNTSSVNYKLVGSAGEYTIEAGKYLVLYTTTAVSVGTKKISLTSSDGSQLKGSIAVRLAQSSIEVQP